MTSASKHFGYDCCYVLGWTASMYLVVEAENYCRYSPKLFAMHMVVAVTSGSTRLLTNRIKVQQASTSVTLLIRRIF